MAWTGAYYHPVVLRSRYTYAESSLCLETWKQARPSRSRQEWVENKWEEIEYDWVKGNLIVPEQLIDILCEQNVEGDADQDSDDDGDGDEGVEMTNMVDEVFEDESDED